MGFTFAPPCRPAAGLSESIPTKKGPKEFVFVEVAKTGRVTNKKHLHEVRKHIMKDIGRSRRKPVAPSKETETQPSVPLKCNKSNQAPPNPTKCGRQHSLMRSYSLGCGRTDPFASYPIEMDSDLLFLVDHGMELYSTFIAYS